jgi:hypothetical protein
LSISNSPLAICPVFGFNISEILIGTYSLEESKQHFERLRQKFQEGIQLSNKVKLRRINRDDYNHLENSRPDLAMEGRLPVISASTFVLEFDPLTNDHEKTVNNVLLAMRLYRTGNIYVTLSGIKRIRLWCICHGSVPHLIILWIIHCQMVTQ